jgi:hypothetical protein
MQAQASAHGMALDSTLFYADFTSILELEHLASEIDIGISRPESGWSSSK